MDTVLRVLDVLVALALIGVVLLQRSEGGGLGMGTSSNSFMSVRGTANFLTRLTAILAAVFMVTSLALAVLPGSSRTQRSIFDTPAAAPASTTTPAPASETPPAAAPAGQAATPPAPQPAAPAPATPVPSATPQATPAPAGAPRGQ